MVAFNTAPSPNAPADGQTLVLLTQKPSEHDTVVHTIPMVSCTKQAALQNVTMMFPAAACTEIIVGVSDDTLYRVTAIIERLPATTDLQSRTEEIRALIEDVSALDEATRG